MGGVCNEEVPGGVDSSTHRQEQLRTDGLAAIADTSSSSHSDDDPGPAPRARDLASHDKDETQRCERIQAREWTVVARFHR